MANFIQLKRSSVQGKKPEESDLQVGELAVNLYDGLLYSKNTAGNIIVVGSSTTSNVTEGVNLYFTNTRAVSALTGGSGIVIAANGRITANVASGSQNFVGLVSEDTFTGNGNQTVYSLSATANSNSEVFVFVNGVVQEPEVNYYVSGSTLTFISAPDSGANVFTRTISSTELNLDDVDLDNRFTTYLTHVAGNIIPAANATYTLGNTTHRFKDIFVSGNSIDLDGIKLTSDGTNIIVPQLKIGSGANSIILKVENNSLKLGNDQNLVSESSLTTANVSEVTNLYFTNARVYSNVIAAGFYDTVSNTAPIGATESGTTLSLSHLNSGVVASTYGGAATIPLYTVNATGHITSASNVAISIPSSALNTDVALGSQTSGAYVANLVAGTGVTIAGLGNEGTTPTISIGQPVGTNNNVTFANVTVTGNLLVQGNAVQFTANNLIVSDPLIQMGVNPVDDSLDLGFFAHYIGGSPSIERHAGLFRDATDGQFKLFTNLDPEPTTIVDTANATYQSANLVVNFVVGKVTDISNHSTTNLAEGSNLYFNNTRAREAISVTGAATYDNTTGVINVTQGVTSVGGSTGAISNAQLLAAVSAVDGTGSGLDADLLDGLSGGGAGAYALKANNLSVFASTTSAQLAGVISDETGSGNLVFNTGPTLTGTPFVSGNIAINGNITANVYRENSVVVSASDINLSLANFFRRTISGTTTFTVSSVPAANTTIAFVLDLTNGGSATVNWFANVRWAGGTAPTLTSAGRDALGFYTYDNGQNWSGLVLGLDIK